MEHESKILATQIAGSRVHHGVVSKRLARDRCGFRDFARFIDERRARQAFPSLVGA